MSNSIDQRIVQMQFDNSQFEQGVSTTLNSLKNLDKSLQLKEGATGIKNIDSAISKLDVSPLSQIADTLNNKFSLMGSVATNAVNRLSNSILDMGESMVRGATIQPLLDGMDEYTTKLNSVQTILTNTEWEGRDDNIGAVTDAINDLNVYADKTIYNFSEMTRNIGTFTAAGVKLDDSKTAIQGIANLAASSGSNAQQASMAMYQMSQALSSGTVRLQDWVSVVNSGMGGKLFQDALKMTSNVMAEQGEAAVSASEAIEKYGSFRESLTKGEWLTSDVLLKTLEHFTLFEEGMDENTRKERENLLLEQGYTKEQVALIEKQSEAAYIAATKVKSFDQLIDTTKEALGSGWGQSWEYIIGNLEQARDLFTPISEAINGAIASWDNARNELLKTWSLGDKDKGLVSGRDALVKGLFNMLGIGKDATGGLVKLIEPIGKALNNVFGGLDASGLIAVSVHLGNMMTAFGKFLGESPAVQAAAKGIEIVFTGVFTAVKILGTLLGGAFMVAITAVGLAFQGVGLLVNFVAETITNGFKIIAEFIGTTGSAISDFGAKLSEITGLESLANTFKVIENAVNNFLAALRGEKTFEAFLGNIDYLKNQKVGDVIREIASDLGNFIETLQPAIDIMRENAPMVFAGAVGAVAFAFNALVTALTPVGNAIIGVKDAMVDLVTGSGLGASITNAITELVGKVQEIFNGITDITDPAQLNQLGQKLGDAFNKALDSVRQSIDNFLKQLSESAPAGLRSVATGLLFIFLTITSIVLSIADIIASLGSAISDAWNEATGGNSIIDEMMGYGEDLRNAFESVTDFGNPAQLEQLSFKIGKTVGDFFGKIGDTIGKALGKFKDSLNLEGGSPLDIIFDVIAKIGEKLSGAFDMVKSFMSGLFSQEMDPSGIFTFFGSFADIFKSGDVEKAAEAADQVEGVATKIKNAAESATFFQDLPTKIGVALADFVNGLADGIDAFLNRLNAEKIQKFISTLGSFAISAGVIKGMYDLSKVLDGFGDLSEALGDVFEQTGKLIKDVRKNVKANAVKSLSEAVKNIAIAIAIIVGSLVVLTYIDHDKMYEVLPVFAAIMAVMVIVPLLLSKFAELQAFDFAAMFQVALMMGELALGIAIMVGLLTFASMAAQNVDISGIGMIVGVVVAFIALSKIMAKIDTGGIREMTASMVSMALSFVLLWAAIEVLGHMDPGVAAQGILLMGFIMVLVGVMIGVMNLITSFGAEGSSAKASNKLLTHMGLIIAECALIVSALGGMDPGQVQQGILALAGIMALIALMTLVMQTINKGAKMKDAKAGAVSLLALAAAVAVFAIAIGALAVISAAGGDIGGATLAIAAALIVLAAACIAISLAADQLDQAAKGILTLIVAVAALAIIMIVFSAIPFETLGTGLLVFVGVVLVAAAALALFGVVGKFLGAGLLVLSAAFLVFGAAILVFGVGLLAIVGALSIFTALSGDFVPAFERFGQALIAMFSTEDFVGSMIGMALAMTLLGVASLALGIGLGVLGLVITAMPNIFQTVANDVLQSINLMANGLAGAKDTIATAVSSLLGGVAQGIMSFAGNALAEGAKLANNIADGLKSFDWAGAAYTVVTTLGGALWNLLSALATIIPEMLAGIGNAIGEGLTSVLTGPLEEFSYWLYDQTGGAMGTMRPAIEENVKETGTGVSEAIDETKEQVVESTNQMYEDTAAATKEGGDKVIENQQDFLGRLNELTGIGGEGGGIDQNSIMNALGLTPDVIAQGGEAVKEQLNSFGIELPTSVTDGIASGGDVDLIGALQEHMDPTAFQDFIKNIGVSGGEQLGVGMSEGLPTSQEVTALIAGQTEIDESALISKFSHAAEAATDAFNKALNGGIKPDLSGKIDSAANQAKQPAKFQAAGNADGSAVTKGFKSGASGMGAAGKSAANAAKDGITGVDMYSPAYNKGKDAGQGIADGIRAKIPSIRAASSAASEAATITIKKVWKTGSPSKVMIQYGKYFGEGLVIGIESMIGNIQSSAEDMGNTALDSVSAITSDITGLFDDIDDNPTIRPVLDLADYEAGIQRMKSLDVSDQTVNAQWANRIGSSGSAAGNNGGNSNQNNINITLDWKAGTTPNQMIQEMANVLQTKNLMEA